MSQRKSLKTRAGDELGQRRMWAQHESAGDGGSIGRMWADCGRGWNGSVDGNGERMRRNDGGEDDVHVLMSGFVSGPEWTWCGDGWTADGG